MYRYGDVETECPIVHEIDDEEHGSVRKPSQKRNRARLEKEWRVLCGELRGPGDECSNEELDERDQKAYSALSVRVHCFRPSLYIPLCGSSLMIASRVNTLKASASASSKSISR